MEGGAVVAIIILAVVFVIGLFCAYQGTYIVKQAEGVVIERLGKFHRVLGSGLNFVVPFIDTARPFTWRKMYIDQDGTVQSEDITQVRIDMRESVFNFMRQEVYTQDTVLLDVNALMYYRITDIKKAIYEVDDLQAAICNMAQTQLKEVFGNMSFAQALGAQNQINAYMKAAFGERFVQWGVQVERLELLDMTPKAGTTISDAMKRQMIAERDRRAEFILAEGKKTAMKLQADGAKLEKYNIGIAEQEATRKLSEGSAGARVELARAESNALETVAAVLARDRSSQTGYMLSQRYMELFSSLIETAEEKTIFLPYDVSSLLGTIAHLPKIYGSKAIVRPRREGDGGTKGEARVQGGEKGVVAGKNYDDLN